MATIFDAYQPYARGRVVNFVCFSSENQHIFYRYRRRILAIEAGVEVVRSCGVRARGGRLLLVVVASNARTRVGLKETDLM